jgi:hypothetical protein
MTSIVELEDRQTALVERLEGAGATVMQSVDEPATLVEGPRFVVWELRGHRIDVPDLDPLQLGRVATMLIEAEGKLDELSPNSKT